MKSNKLTGKAFNIFATLRSFRTPVTASNMSKMMYNAISSIGTIDGLYYTVEGDRYSKNTHAHILISGSADRKEFAKTIKRSATSELCYWDDSVNDVSGAIIYSTKKIKNKSDVIHDYGYINRDSDHRRYRVVYFLSNSLPKTIMFPITKIDIPTLEISLLLKCSYRMKPNPI